MKPEISPTESVALTWDFVRRFASTTFGVRAARLAAVEQLATWGWPQDSGPCLAVALVVAELAANAVIHGGRGAHEFELRLTVESARRAPTTTLRIEVSDRQDKVPTSHATPPAKTAESGRGLLLVDALTTGRGVEHRLPTGKTVWATLDLPARTNSIRR
jgi:anti-sigma regulatory factor (Ser/Thr protein kinase)